MPLEYAGFAACQVWVWLDGWKERRKCHLHQSRGCNTTLLSLKPRASQVYLEYEFVNDTRARLASQPFLQVLREVAGFPVYGLRMIASEVGWLQRLSVGCV